MTVVALAAFNLPLMSIGRPSVSNHWNPNEAARASLRGKKGESSFQTSEPALRFTWS